MCFVQLSAGQSTLLPYVARPFRLVLLDRAALLDARPLASTSRKRIRMSDSTDKSLEAWIWDAACSIRGAKDTPKYKEFILPLHEAAL